MQGHAVAGELLRHQRAARLDQMDLARTSGQENGKHAGPAPDVDHARFFGPVRQNEIRRRLEPVEHCIAHRRISEHICGIELLDAVWVEPSIVDVTAMATRDDVERSEPWLQAKRGRWTERMDRHFIHRKYRL